MIIKEDMGPQSLSNLMKIQFFHQKWTLIQDLSSTKFFPEVGLLDV